MWWWCSQASHCLRELLGKPTARHHTRPIAGEPRVIRARPDYAPRASHASRGEGGGAGGQGGCVVVVMEVVVEDAGAVLASPTQLTLPHLPHEDWASRLLSSASSRRRYMIMIL